MKNAAEPTYSDDGIPRACMEIADIKKDLHEEFAIRIQGT
jgi:hypothetical protein